MLKLKEDKIEWGKRECDIDTDGNAFYGGVLRLRDPLRGKDAHTRAQVHAI